ncbi:MAG: DUF4476 domain-containing protein [Bacteroidales bacterium]|nr:DUF4476 domain-containing protein [Bacteroidales bacterium]MCF8458147.1 DUF4476 domain-containing protein [Bacteroidales bacterium]
MKTIFISLTLLLFVNVSFSQNCNVVFFSEDGDKFLVVLDGIQFNEQGETNVKITDVTATNHTVKIIFEDKSKGEINKNLYLQTPNKESTFIIKKNKKGEYKLRFNGETNIIVEQPSTPKSGNHGNHSPNQNQQTEITETSVQQTVISPTSNKTNSENVNIGINVGEGANNVNFNINMSSTTTQTTETSTSAQQQTLIENKPPPPPPPIPGYNGPYGCPYPMDPGSFQSAKSSIQSKSFEDSKMTLAKQIIRSNCLSVAQVKEIMLLFSFEDTRLDFAKFAYRYTCDIGNYFMVNDAFTFESTIEELDEYIQQQR